MRAPLLCFAPILLLAVGCAHPTVHPPTAGQAYRASWNVRRAADGKPLAAVVSQPVRVGGGELRVRADDPRRADEERPSFTEFLVRLSPMRRSTQIEVVTRVTVLEAHRNKKGKLKVSKRFIGGLLPMRPGEKLGVSGPGDPIAVEVELDGGGAVK